MSVVQTTKRKSVPEIKATKGPGSLVALTAYTAPLAKIADKHADIVLVGDSLGMVLYGMESTLSVTLDMMIAHGKAVAKSTQRACVLVDMPWGSYQQSPEQAYASAARVMAETNAQGVKLEGNAALAPTVEFLVQRGIPVMAHVGLMPQYSNIYGGHKVQGRDRDIASVIKADAKAMEDAGAFSMVIEGVVEPLAREVTSLVSVPVIGIGASPACDGQILVTEDVLGLFDDFQPKFVKRYAHLNPQIDTALANFASDIRSGKFPEAEQCYTAPSDKPYVKKVSG